MDITCVDVEAVVNALKRSMEEVVRFQTRQIEGSLTITFKDGMVVALAIHKPVLH